ncbi:MAG: SDR family oxidoreductase [Treponema sp.]|uniref:SDR family oxidoreductase n=1 Tax=Treponema sp. TaxID=166 RepID=UPI00298D7DCD|nr:SDR family oxidoreductase [Treponema sp.]MCQ2601086.1 SDR family oxidoreductase [Treponema sp.]
MKVLFIGGTGTISMAITKQLAEEGHEVFLINRGSRTRELPQSVKIINADINDEEDVKSKIAGMSFDSVCDFIGFVPSQLERDYRLFNGKTKQFMYISSASAYHKPCRGYVITEGTALANPYWEYSRNKIACEDLLMKYYREEGFPVTIIRPSHTYDERSVPLGVHGSKGSWQVVKRMLQGKPVIIHGDGTSLWTMTHNSDFAKGFCGLVGNPHAIGEAFQITNDETLTWNQIYECIADALGVKLNAIHVSSELLASISDYDFTGSLIGDKACSVVFDNSKLKKAVPEFKATVHFEEGIRRTVENVVANPDLQQDDPEFDAWCDKVVKTMEFIKQEFKKA